jgi:hypothetical protein
LCDREIKCWISLGQRQSRDIRGFVSLDDLSWRDQRRNLAWRKEAKSWSWDCKCQPASAWLLLRILICLKFAIQEHFLETVSLLVILLFARHSVLLYTLCGFHWKSNRIWCTNCNFC